MELKRNRRGNGNEKRMRILHEVLDWSRVIATGLALAFVISNTLIANAQVPTGSMEETIMPGSRIIINRLAYMSKEPSRGDIISFYYPDDGKSVYLKRVIGLPGESVEGREGRVYVDGAVLDEEYVEEAVSADFGPFLIPSGSYFVMGDNRNNSWDSRYWENPYVEKDEIIGRAEFEYFPEFKWFR